MKNKLTALEVKTAPPGRHQDGGGLFLRVLNENKRTWFYRFMPDGKRRDMGLGNLSLSAARKARDHAADLVQRGIDPIVERERAAHDAQIARQVIDPTFAEMTQEVFEANKETLRAGGTRGRWMSPLKLHILPKIGAIPMIRITTDHIKSALAPIWRTKHPTAERAFHRTRFIFSKARLKGVDGDPITLDRAKEDLGVVKHMVRHIESTPWRDIPDLFAQLNDGTPTSAAIRFAMLTLVRSAGVRGRSSVRLTATYGRCRPCA